MALSSGRLVALSGISAASGIALWLGAAFVSLNYYDEGASSPWWLTAWWVTGGLLFAAGVVGVLVGMVVEIARRMRT